MKSLEKMKLCSPVRLVLNFPFFWFFKMNLKLFLESVYTAVIWIEFLFLLISA